MIDALYIGATGMHAQQTAVDTISNNLANVSTVGYKRSRANFEDLMYRDVARGVGPVSGPDDGLRMGAGVGVSRTGKVFTEGDIKKTDNPLDIAIRGHGFLEVVLPDGTSAYSRTGSLKIEKDGFLAMSDGHQLKGSMQIPSDASEVLIKENGEVFAKLPNEDQPMEIGKLELVNFSNASALNPVGEGLYVATEGSGDGIRGYAGENGFGTLAQGFVESSNVKLVDEVISLVVAQRAYEVNAKVIQASDEMLAISNNLRK